MDELGLDRDTIAKNVLNSVTDIALDAYTDNIPLGDKVRIEGHAKDNVKISGIKTSKYSNKYKVLGFNGDRGYLFMREYGTSKVPPKPWVEKANQAVRNAVREPMKQALIEEINGHLRSV